MRGTVSIQKLPIWVEPQAENGTPLDKAFDLTAALVQAWINENPDSFPPIVINVIGSRPNDLARVETSAQHLLGLGTSDGTVLLFNAYISDSSSTSEIKLPRTVGAGVLKAREALLEGFNFFKIQNATSMPDRVPLFGLQLADKRKLVCFLKERGLEID